MSRYLLQDNDPYSCCYLYALVNALRFFGRPTTRPGTDEWEDLVDLALCRHGAAIVQESAALHLGLALEKVSPNRAKENAPAILSVWNPHPRGGSLHAALIIGNTRNAVTLVNYRWKTGPVVEEVEWPPPMPRYGLPTRKAWLVRLKEVDA